MVLLVSTPLAYTKAGLCRVLPHSYLIALRVLCSFPLLGRRFSFLQGAEEVDDDEVRKLLEIAEPSIGDTFDPQTGMLQ